MLPLKTKDDRNLKVLTILLKPTTLGHQIVFVCIDKNFKPEEVDIKDVEWVGR